MPFTDPILGGDFFIRPQMKSPNYVAGVSGWIIRKDGTVEFNNGTFRGSISIGPAGGPRFVINNTVTGDPLDIYDASNKLILSISQSGFLTTIRQATNSSAQYTGNSIQFLDTVSPAAQGAAIIGFGKSTSPGSTLSLFSGGTGITTDMAQIQLFDKVSNGGIPAIIMEQRGRGGAAVQTDTGTNAVANIVHIAQYGVTYAVAGNAQVFNHGCAFTPSGCIVSFDDGSAINSATVSIATGTLTATTARLYTVYEPGGANPGAGDLVIIQAMFWE